VEVKMGQCPKCNTEYEGERNYCRSCGSFLLTEKIHTLTVEGVEPDERDKAQKHLVCPKCQALYDLGNYCRKCGSLLVQRTNFQETTRQPLEKGLIKKWSKQWQRLFKEMNNLKTCLSKLETQRDRVSTEVFDQMFTRYQDQLESLSSLHQEIEAQLKSVRKRASEEIELLEKELTPLQKRLQEIESLHRLGAITQADFSDEKKAMKQEIKSRQKSLKEYRHFISLLPNKMEGNRIPSERVTFSVTQPNGQDAPSGLTSVIDAVKFWVQKLIPYLEQRPFILFLKRGIGGVGRVKNFLRPLPLMVASGVLVLLVIGGYLLWNRDSQTGASKSGKIAASLSSTPAPQSQLSVPGGQESDTIGSLFDNIQQANLQKDIDLFMSCYSRHFKESKEKRVATLKAWEHFDYLDLSYELKNQKITGNMAIARVKWLIRTSAKPSGKPQDSEAVLDVTLQKEEGQWKIKEIKSAS
jgi:hypothetical protein